MEKYKLVKNNFILHEGRKLYRIKALRDIINNNRYIEKGELGGYVERYCNLSQEGECWIYDNAKVYGNATVKDSALVGNNAEVFGNAVVEDKAKVYGNARVKDSVSVAESSEIFGNAIAKGNALVRGSVYGNARIEDGVFIYTGVSVYDNAIVKGYTKVHEYSQIFGNAIIEDIIVDCSSKIYDNTVLLIGGYTFNKSIICGNTFAKRDEEV